MEKDLLQLTQITSIALDIKASIAIHGEELSLEYIDEQMDNILGLIKSLEKKHE